jgi:peptidoglycan/LPS O-acetylase OafA/YrhL
VEGATGHKLMSSVAGLETTRPISPTKRFYRPELDCLRFFAFLGVFVSHTFSTKPEYYAARHIPFPDLFASAARAGSFGVDLFFLLSAYLITELLLREKDQFGSVHLRSFYLRRILRIWPLYFLALFIGISLTLIDRDQHFPLKFVFAFLLLAGNWLTSFVGFPGSVMDPLWSVSFEEQFYLLWPSIVSRVRKIRTLVLIALCLIAAAEIGRLLLLRFARGIIFTNSIAHLDSLALGIVSVIWLRQRPFDPARWSRLGLLSAGITVWLASSHFYALTRVFMLLGYPAMAFGAWLIFLSALGVSRAPRWLRYLGKISYGLYVFHLLSLHIVMHLLGDYPHDLRSFIRFVMLGLGLTVLIAASSYRMFESPFLRYKERFAFVKSRPV